MLFLAKFSKNNTPPVSKTENARRTKILLAVLQCNLKYIALKVASNQFDLALSCLMNK